jgi:hypothetical protein
MRIALRRYRESLALSSVRVDIVPARWCSRSRLLIAPRVALRGTEDLGGTYEADLIP